jgi:hypothetical protein
MNTKVLAVLGVIVALLAGWLVVMVAQQNAAAPASPTQQNSATIDSTDTTPAEPAPEVPTTVDVETKVDVGEEGASPESTDVTTSVEIE